MVSNQKMTEENIKLQEITNNIEVKQVSMSAYLGFKRVFQNKLRISQENLDFSNNKCIGKTQAFSRKPGFSQHN